LSFETHAGEPALRRWAATLEELSARSRAAAGGDVARELLRARRAAFEDAVRLPAAQPLPHADSDFPVDPRVGLPVVHGTPTASDVRRAIDGHGSLVVRGLIGKDRAKELRETARDALAARQTAAAGGTVDPSWFTEFEPIADENARQFTSEAGMFTADSPRGHFLMVEALRESGIVDVASTVLGARPAVSVEKCVFRRVDPGVYATYHQDGAFLGERIETLDVWIALTRCGRTASALEIFPRRVDRVLPTGGFFDWDLSDETVNRAYPGVAPVRPEFEEGDALIFDQLCVHRTSSSPEMNATRFALECWLFAPASVPPKYTGLLL
jgi:hypothetical protein